MSKINLSKRLPTQRMLLFPYFPFKFEWKCVDFTKLHILSLGYPKEVEGSNWKFLYY